MRIYGIREGVEHAIKPFAIRASSDTKSLLKGLILRLIEFQQLRFFSINRNNDDLQRSIASM